MNHRTKYKIMLVEDEETLAAGLEYNLSEEGYEVDWLGDGRKALESFSRGKYDLIILDIMLPYFNGFEVAEKIREQDPRMPILMLTARTAIDDRVKGLETGADDYMTKPFHLKELLLRIKGMLKRKEWYAGEAGKGPNLHFGINDFNFESLIGTHGKKEFHLTPLEASVLKYMSDQKEKIISRGELLEEVWHLNPEMETRTVDNFIVRLRKYFEDDPSEPVHIISVRGAGYMFKE